MDDLSAAISGFLSKPGAMEQLESMAKQLGLGGETPQTDEPVQDAISPEKLQQVLKAVNDGAKPDQTTVFLEALRPLLHPEKQEKLDRAIRAIRLMRTARTVTQTIEL